jgi:hypothetical protein
MNAREAEAFRAWAESKRYSDSTIVGAIRKVRRAHGFGISSPDEVEEKYPSISNGSRSSVKTVLRMYSDFLEAAA